MSDKFPWVADYTPFAGIGARETPESILALMRGIAAMLAERGYTLRSGGARGADTAFEYATPVIVKMEIFLPWNGFEGKHDTIQPTAAQLAAARSIAEKHHPNWIACTDGAKKMFTRNVMQILGLRCNSPSKFVVCWTRDGKATGGTGHALRVAAAHDVKIYNLHDPAVRGMFYEQLGWEHDV
jgi:hypothetical protein